MNRVTNIAWRTASGSRLGGFAYRYDALGRIVSRAHDLGGASFDRDYAYDGMDRLASDGDTAYAYDAAGNRTSRTESGETVTYSLGAGDRLATWTGGSYRYDGAGCVTRITRGADTWDLAWNGQYQLISVSTNGAFAEAYAYDALGRRVTTRNAVGTERHVYDDNWQVIADLDANGGIIRSYVWGEGIDRLLAVKIGDRTYTALTDVQGTVWGYADEQGDVVAKWTYDAWGNVLSEEVADGAAELRAVRYRFQGRERSAATGLANFRMRWYDAITGRWLSKDPIGLCGGLNLYAFCGDDPINCADKHGCSAAVVLPGLIIAPGAGPDWHHGDRKRRNNPLPSKPPVDDPSWKRLPPWQSKYHDNGIGKPEVKYINDDGREAVYDGDTCELITDDENGGTYNYVNPATDGDGIWSWMWRSVGHGGADMVPYWLWGN